MVGQDCDIGNYTFIETDVIIGNHVLSRAVSSYGMALPWKMMFSFDPMAHLPMNLFLEESNILNCFRVPLSKMVW